jgi:alpha-tubulin suppressor-like RCC1 family protein
MQLRCASMDPTRCGRSERTTRRRALTRGSGLCLVAVMAVADACGSTDPGRPSLWTALDAGLGGYTCGLSTDGEAFCWGGVGGYYDPFPLEDSLVSNSAVPLPVPGGRRFVNLTVGGLSKCALDAQRGAYCWGANQRGEVGDGSHLAKRGPSPVSGGLRWRTISAGGVHACGITVDKEAYCWGNDFRGAVGNGRVSFSTSPEPTAVLGGLTFDSLYAGPGTSCGLTSDGTAYCWGVNDYGRLGDGEPPEPGKEAATPSLVVGGHRFSSLSMGGAHVCALTSDARAYCWGWNQYGQLGNGTTTHSSSPVAVSGGHRWRLLTSGEFHTCGLTSDSTLYCWGHNARGQFGNGTKTDASSPQLIAASGTYVSVTAGTLHTCGLTAVGTAFCWGRGDFGQLGNGAFADSPRPTQVASYR